MTIHLPLRRTTRRNTLAACLAAALAASAAGASGPLHPAFDAPRAPASSDEAIFGALHTSRVSGAQDGTTRADSTPTSVLPTQPADDLTVTNCYDDGLGSLRYAAAAAHDGDVIHLEGLSCPTITLTSGAIGIEAPNVRVQGPGQDALTIEGVGPGRVFTTKYALEIGDLTLANGGGNNTGAGGCLFVGGNLVLTRSAVTGCHTGDGSNPESRGGGVYVGGDLTMQSSTISGNAAAASDSAYGGGAYVLGDATLDDSTIVGNTATADIGEARGGGLFARDGVFAYDSQLVNNTAISANGAAYGGAVSSEGGNIKIVRSTISGNTSDSQSAANLGFGGGLHAGSADGSASLQLLDSTLSGNIVNGGAVSMGGGAWVAGAIAAFHSTISDNQALLVASLGRALGGGLVTNAAGIAGQITLANSTVSGNSAIGGNNGGYGGGIASGSPFAVWNSTIAFNSASTSGGGIVGGTDGGAPTLNGTIVANNSAPDGADIARSSDVPFVIAGTNNLVMAAGTGFTFDVEPIHADPLLQDLAPNGGPTMTHALGAGSPALDAGNNLLDFAYDQRGCPYARIGANAPDIGAFEMQTETPDHIFGDNFDGGEPLCP